MKEATLRVLLITMATLVGLIVAEAGVRVSYPWLPGRIQTVVAHVQTWRDPPRDLGPSWTEYCVGDDELGAFNRPNLEHAPVQFGPAYYHLTTHDLGFDGIGFRTSLQATGFDGVVVGDSFAFCHHVEQVDCWVDRLSSDTGLRLANLGVPGTGSASHSRFLERYGRQLEPRLVLWQFWVNDPRDDVEHVLMHALPCPKPSESPPLASRSWRERLKTGSVLANLVHHAVERLRGTGQDPRHPRLIRFEAAGNEYVSWRGEVAPHNSAAGQQGFSFTTAAIGLAARRTSASGGHFLLVVAPSNLQILADDLTEPALKAIAGIENHVSDALIEWAREHDIQVLDLRAAFREATERGEVLYPPYDVHWTAAGNRLAAVEIARELERRGWF